MIKRLTQMEINVLVLGMGEVSTQAYLNKDAKATALQLQALFTNASDIIVHYE